MVASHAVCVDLRTRQNPTLNERLEDGCCPLTPRTWYDETPIRLPFNSSQNPILRSGCSSVMYPVHQPQPDSYADFIPPPPFLLGDIMTAPSSSSVSPPPVSPSPHDSPPPASTITWKKNQPYRKKETVDEAILVYTALRQ